MLKQRKVSVDADKFVEFSVVAAVDDFSSLMLHLFFCTPLFFSVHRCLSVYVRCSSVESPTELSSFAGMLQHI